MKSLNTDVCGLKILKTKICLYYEQNMNRAVKVNSIHSTRQLHLTIHCLGCAIIQPIFWRIIFCLNFFHLIQNNIENQGKAKKLRYGLQCTRNIRFCLLIIWEHSYSACASVPTPASFSAEPNLLYVTNGTLFNSGPDYKIRDGFPFKQLL